MGRQVTLMSIRKYERSLFVLCECNKVQELPLDESEVIRVTGKPKNIAEGKCDRCGREIIVYALLWMGTHQK